MTMGITCIVTDAYVQFPQPSFHGRQMVKILPQGYRFNGHLYPFASELKAGDLPSFPSENNFPGVIFPSQEQICQLFAAIEEERTYDRILAILTSSQLTPVFTQVKEALQSFSGRVQIQLIDSHSTSIGLGFLVQNAVEAILKNSSFSDVELLVRRLIPQIYAIVCTPCLSYLYKAGFVDQSQALVGEMLGLQPLFALEEGHLTPLEKVRNHRQVLDSFQEFLDEFENLQHIGLVQNITPNSQDSRLLREHAQSNFPKTPFTEHSINLALAALLGPQTSGLFAVECQGRKNR
jgi:DegV family protein with EDD domain